MNETTQLTLIYLTGIFFVVIFALHFFNDPAYRPGDKDEAEILEPALPRYMTERTRYHLYLFAFVIATLILYFFVSLLFPMLVASIMEIELKDPEKVSAALAMVVGTLAFINLSTKIPWLKDTLSNWKLGLHKKADIPEKAFRVYNSLKFSELNRKSDIFTVKLAKILHQDGQRRTDLDEDYFNFSKDRLERQWARLVYLMFCLDEWAEKDQFKRHINSTNLRWLPLREHYQEQLIPTMIQFHNGQLSDTEINSVKQDVRQTLTRVYWLITLLLFMANRAAEDPCIHLKNIGWVIQTEYYFRFSSQFVLISGVIVFFSILMGAVLGAIATLVLRHLEILPGSSEINAGDLFTWVLYGVPMFVVPSIIVLMTKRFLSMHEIWKVQRPEDLPLRFAARPWTTYFFVAVMAYTVTVAILLIIATALSIGKPTSLINVMQPIMGFAGVAFITSIYACYLIDSPRVGWEKNLSFYIKSMPFAVIQGLANTAVIIFSFIYFFNGQSFDITKLSDVKLGRLVVYIVIGFLIGIALFISSRIRSTHYERRAIDRQEEDAKEIWQTICVDAVIKRVKVIYQTNELVEFELERDIMTVADVGDKVEFYLDNGKTLLGKIAAITAESLQVAIPDTQGADLALGIT